MRSGNCSFHHGRNGERITDWARGYWQALYEHLASGSYVTFTMEERKDWIRATYGSNDERLRKVKAVYDPDNFFRVNQSSKPVP